MADPGSSVAVAVRIRPPNRAEQAHGTYQCAVATGPEAGRVVLSGCTTFSSKKKEAEELEQAGRRAFQFDHAVGPDVTQAEMFERVGRPLADALHRGIHGCLLAYGQTGAGKTYTMQGPEGLKGGSESEQRGLIQRTFERVFALIERSGAVGKASNTRVESRCSCTYLQIYNETVLDLLDPSAEKQIAIREDKHGLVMVDGARQEELLDPEQAFEVFKRGNKNRRVGSTALNAESSRSHAIFCIHLRTRLESREGDRAQVAERNSSLYLVDLAGSERQRDAKTTGQALKEAGSINKSLSQLGNTIKSLAEMSEGKSQAYIPYRNSKLTFLLKNALIGRAKCTLVANISPAQAQNEETLSTLVFASRAKLVQNTAAVNEEVTYNPAALHAELKRLKAENEKLRAAGPPAAAPPAGPDAPPAAGPAAGASEEAAARIEGLHALLVAERKAVQDARAGVEEEKRHLAGKVADLGEQAKRLETELQSTQIRLRMKEEKISRLQTDLEPAARWAGEVAALGQEVRELKKQLECPSDAIKYKMEAADARRQLQRTGDLQQERAELAAKAEKLMNELTHLVAEKQVLEAAAKSAKKNLHKLERAFKEQNLLQEEMFAKLTKGETEGELKKVAHLKATINSLSQQIEQIKSDSRDELEQIKSHAKEELEQLREEQGQHVEELNRVAAAAAARQQELRALEVCETLVDTLVEDTSKHVALETALEDLEAARRQIDGLRAAGLEAEGALRDAADRADARRAREAERADALAARVAALDGELRAAADGADAARAKLRAKEEAMARHTELLRAKDAELDRAEEQAMDQEAALNALRARAAEEAEAARAGVAGELRALLGAAGVDAAGEDAPGPLLELARAAVRRLAAEAEGLRAEHDGQARAAAEEARASAAELERLRADLAGLRAAHAALEAQAGRAAELEARLAAVDADLGAARGELAAQERAGKELKQFHESEMEIAGHQIGTLNHSLEDLRRQLAAADAAAGGARDELAAARAEAAEHQALTQKLQAVLHDRDNEVLRQRERLDEMAERVQAASLEKEFKEEELHGSLQAARAELATLQERSASVLAQKAELEARLEADAAAAAAERGDLQRRAAEAATTASAAEGKEQELRAAAEQLEAALRASEAELDKVQFRASELEVQLEELEQAALSEQDATVKLSSYKKELSYMETAHDGMTKAFKDLKHQSQKEKRRYEKQVQDLQQEVRAEAEERAALEGRLEQLAAEKRRISLSQQDTLADVDRENHRRQSAVMDKIKAEQEVVEIKAEMEQLRRGAQAERDGLRAELAELRAKLKGLAASPPAEDGSQGLPGVPKSAGRKPFGELSNTPAKANGGTPPVKAHREAVEGQLVGRRMTRRMARSLGGAGD